MSTVQELIYDAMRLSGITRYAGRTPSTDELTDARRNLNRMLSSWGVEKLMAYSINRKVYDMNPAAASYSLGPDADWNDTRPVRIEQATLLYYGDSGLPVELPLKMYDDTEWSNIRLKDFTSTIPQGIYNNNNFPITQIYFYPIPSVSSNKLVLYVWQPFSATGDLSEDVNFPDGYEDAIVYNLAVRLHGFWSHGEKTPLDPEVTAEAVRLKAALKKLNIPDLKMRPDTPSRGTGGRFDIYSGEVIPR